jgi:hypothetical protein
MASTATSTAAGITLERNTRGEVEYARINLQQYGDKLRSFFVSEGIEISPYNPTLVEKVKRGERQIASGQYKVVPTQDLWK